MPSSVTKITIKVTDGHGHTTHDLTVTTPGIVGRIIGLYNSLGVIEPATIMGCPGEPEGSLTLRFYRLPDKRDRDGELVRWREPTLASLNGRLGVLPNQPKNRPAPLPKPQRKRDHPAWEAD